MATEAAAATAAGSAASAPSGEAGRQPEVPHAAKAWEFFRSIGAPKFHVAPMVDQSELPFRRLCRKYGATCAYTPMLHARLFCEDAKYRSETFTTCECDRPLFIQFCANDPDYLVRAASMLVTQGDAIDINFGCPQRIARRGQYGAFLMDTLELVERLVKGLVNGVPIPVTCKIRVFPNLADTIAYARMIEAAGCSVLAVHGRTREQKDLSATRADWDQIKAVKQALSIPVLANGNVRHLQDALDLMAYTGADGVLSAESLLEDPALFSPQRLLPGGARRTLDGIQHCIEYLKFCLETPTHMRMVKGHVHRLCGPWLAEHIDIRAEINRGHLDIAGNLRMMEELAARVAASGRDEPIPAVNPKHIERMKKEEARKAAIEEQEREAAALAAIGAADSVEALNAAAAAAGSGSAVAAATGTTTGAATAPAMSPAAASGVAAVAGVAQGLGVQQHKQESVQGLGHVEVCNGVAKAIASQVQRSGNVAGGGAGSGEGEGGVILKKRRADSAGNVAGMSELEGSDNGNSLSDDTTVPIEAGGAMVCDECY